MVEDCWGQGICKRTKRIEAVPCSDRWNVCDVCANNDAVVLLLLLLLLLLWLFGVVVAQVKRPRGNMSRESLLLSPPSTYTQLGTYNKNNYSISNKRRNKRFGV